MYESPVNVIYGEMQTQIEGDIFKAIQNVGIDVNKEELIKSLQYDRGQYEKGYSDGYAKSIDEFAERLDDLILHGVFDSRNHLYECIHEIAEQMKGGAVNG